MFCTVCLTIVFGYDYDYLILPVIVFTLVYLLDEQTHFARALSTKAMIYLGNISYALYMVQLFALHMGTIMTPKAGNIFSDHPFYAAWMFYFPFTITVCLLLAIATHHLIERPARKRLKQYAGKTGAD
jgi:peptidoglycan/LPS O-acetylase OafA/YrhL